MGINVNNRTLIEKYALPALPSKYEVYELGNQMVRDPTGDYPAEQYYKLLGCGKYDCLDVNGGGTLNVDLNYPVENLQPRDLVTDFGTSEHVFNIGTCWKNIFDMCKVDGIILFEKIIHGYRNHGFYNIQPTFISSLASDNGAAILYSEFMDDKKGTRFRGVIQKKRENFTIPTQERYREMIHGTGKGE